MSGRRRFIYPNGFHWAMLLCFRAFDAVKLMTSGASPMAQMSGAVFRANATARHSLPPEVFEPVRSQFGQSASRGTLLNQTAAAEKRDNSFVNRRAGLWLRSGRSVSRT